VVGAAVVVVGAAAVVVVAAGRSASSDPEAQLTDESRSTPQRARRRGMVIGPPYRCALVDQLWAMNPGTFASIRDGDLGRTVRA
jgi:hypothetical protein